MISRISARSIVYVPLTNVLQNSNRKGNIVQLHLILPVDLLTQEDEIQVKFTLREGGGG